MGKVSKALGSIVGIGGQPKVKPAAVAPIETKVIEETKTDEELAKKKRAALYETSGGAGGQELAAGQVSQRPTLFGN